MNSFMFQPSFHSIRLSTVIIGVVNGSRVLTFSNLINDVGMIHSLNAAISSSLQVNFVIFVFNTQQVVLDVQFPEFLIVVSFKILFCTRYNWDHFFGLDFFLIRTIIIHHDLFQVDVDELFTAFVKWLSIQFVVPTFPNLEELLGNIIQGNFLFKVSERYFLRNDFWAVKLEHADGLCYHYIPNITSNRQGHNAPNKR